MADKVTDNFHVKKKEKQHRVTDEQVVENTDTTSSHSWIRSLDGSGKLGHSLTLSVPISRHRSNKERHSLEKENLTRDRYT